MTVVCSLSISSSFLHAMSLRQKISLNLSAGMQMCCLAILSPLKTALPGVRFPDVADARQGMCLTAVAPLLNQAGYITT
ncbi:hypothetical protein SAMN05428958_1294 [Pantoea sesami]|nr:hypothetical protein SAMN05428958_1294 [Pantoea sesami]